MFESAELGNRVSKEDFARREPELRTRLLEVQRTVAKKEIPVVVLVSGVEGAGKGQVVNRLNEWLDPRGVRTHAFWDETDEERERPRYWRFWRTLPPRGALCIMFGSWYTWPIIDRVFGDMNEAAFARELARIADFERMLSDDGALVVKLWLHLSRDAQKARLRKARKKSGRNWEASPLTRKYGKRYRAFAAVSEHAIRDTDTAVCPWHVVEAEDRRFRDLAVGEVLLNAMEQRIAASDGVAELEAGDTAVVVPARTVLDQADLDAALDEEAYREQLRSEQRRLHRLSWEARAQRRSSVLVFEGWDAAGKGGAIRRLVAAMDARLYQVVSVAAPSDEEKARHYLWRFWRHLPMSGYVTVFDRSWYGRVLVERVERFASPDEWMRAYREINAFEEQLAEHGIVVTKYWLHLSKEEQLRRFQERERTPWKAHKITEEDWRNRERWDDYRLAVHDMLTRTSTDYAPWVVVPAQSKRFARVQVLRTVCDRLEASLK